MKMVGSLRIAAWIEIDVLLCDLLAINSAVFRQQSFLLILDFMIIDQVFPKAVGGKPIAFSLKRPLLRAVNVLSIPNNDVPKRTIASEYTHRIASNAKDANGDPQCGTRLALQIRLRI
jgi:hypothetical protein